MSQSLTENNSRTISKLDKAYSKRRLPAICLGHTNAACSL